MLVGIPLFMGAYYVGNQLYRQPFTWQVASNVGLMLLLVTVLWQVIRLIWAALLRRYPAYQQATRRLVLTVFTSGLAGMVLATLVFDVKAALLADKVLAWSTVGMHFGPMFFFSALVVGAHEVVRNFYELRRLDQERQELKKAHLQSQLDSLKSQVNPHFLFNSLNSLLSLISTSPERAERFVEELSSVYRYLLQANEKELATLRQELDFAHSYFHLLHTRFGAGIRLSLEIDEALLDYLLPSLTLQLLLENAVKHNVISASQPLFIHIGAQIHRLPSGGEARLVVRNNLQRKIQAVASNRMGLNNIMSKLKLLNQREVTITEEDGCFTVVLPLFKSNP